MASSEEVTKDIIVAAIQQGIISRINISSSNKESNKATAESLAEVFEIIYKKVHNAHNL